MARRRETQVRRAMLGKWQPLPATWRVVVRRERVEVEPIVTDADGTVSKPPRGA